VHSYDLDYSWVRDINLGLNRIFEKYSYNIRYYYMNTKRNPDKEYLEKVGNTVTKMIQDWEPNILIAIDDNAQEYVAKRFIDHPKIKIIYAGVNADLATYGYDKAKNVTGILERLPFDAFKEVFLQILPKNEKRIIHIADASETSHYIQHEIEALDWSPLILKKTILCKSLEEWNYAIDYAQKNADILFITHYHTIKDKNGAVIKPSKIIELTEPKLRIPAIGSWGFYVEDGGMMAVAVSPYEQGEEAAKMAIKILENKEEIKNIKPQVSRLFVIYVRKKDLEKRNLKIPKLLEAFARATNNFYE
jgi:ABC-type uncharacterized transport system substrate-binding protein